MDLDSRRDGEERRGMLTVFASGQISLRRRGPSGTRSGKRQRSVRSPVFVRHFLSVLTIAVFGLVSPVCTSGGGPSRPRTAASPSRIAFLTSPALTSQCNQTDGFSSRPIRRRVLGSTIDGPHRRAEARQDQRTSQGDDRPPKSDGPFLGRRAACSHHGATSDRGRATSSGGGATGSGKGDGGCCRRV